jgi:HD-GYP domain-containing protein (c-di-GMP phosphodiesterase class II)
MDEDLRLAELLAALSVATDLGMGHEPEKAIRSCLLATELARALDLPEPQVRDVYYASMLIHLGCTASAYELTYLFGDDRSVLAVAEQSDTSTVAGTLQMLRMAGAAQGRGRAQHLARVLAGGSRASTTLLRSVCEVGSRMAQRLRLGENVAAALSDSTEVWNGRGSAYGRQHDEIALPARFALLATQAVIVDRLAGPDAARAMVRSRSGAWLDPDIATAFDRYGSDLLDRHARLDVWELVLDAEPEPARIVPASYVDDMAGVFADMVDLKSPYTHGHSSGVTELAVAAATTLGMSGDSVTCLRRAALLHDLGRVAVDSAIWSQTGPLTSTQWEQVRLHPYHTERILSRSRVLDQLASMAGMHHERQDGSGYHHGVAASAIPTEARLLAAADVLQAMTQPRPHRQAIPIDQAAAHVEQEASIGKLDVECARAVVAAASNARPPRRIRWPAGLTDREVDVLRLVAAGQSNRDIAEELVVSRRTAEHHVQSIYAKIGSSTRAAAALFAMEHGLVR